MKPLSRAEIGQVLHYWLAALRFEEALAIRPVARRLDPHRPRKPSLREPSGAQGYCKISAAEAPFFLKATRTLELPTDQERDALFERWLKGRYSQQSGARGGEEGAWMAGFPVIHEPRSGELATLLRFRVTVGWLDEAGVAWKTPSWRSRQGASLPEPPVTMKVIAEEEDEDLLPFTLDTQLLTHTLGVADEDLTEFLDALQGLPNLSPRRMVAAVCALLETDTPQIPPPPEPSAPLFERLQAAVQARLTATASRAYPVGLIYDGSQVFATWHLQRELRVLLKHPPGEGRWTRETPLWRYLSGKRVAATSKPLRGVFSVHGLTDDQRAVASAFLGSRLTAAQGPPGTGKTALILSLAAHTIVERVSALSGRRAMPRDLMVVTSTNNRAVDNVLDQLSELGGVPLALRVGNQEVTAEITASRLEQIARWLEIQKPAAPAEDYKTALRAFAQLRKALDEHTGPRLEVQKRVERLETLRAQRAELEGAEEITLAEEKKKLVERLRTLAHRLTGLDHRLAQRSAPGLNRVKDHWRSTRSRHVEPLKVQLDEMGLKLDLRLPPKIPKDTPLDAQIEAWEARVGAALEAIEALKAEVEAELAAHRRWVRRQRLEEELAALDVEGEAAAVEITATPTSDAEEQRLEHALFDAALRVREAWCLVHKEALTRALNRATSACRSLRSMRRLLDEDADAGDWLARLFPVWGSTLLSMGNVFPPEPAALSRLIIDEAGQCHPAYAISGLMRAKRALLIGDVHQLEPVIRLTPVDELRVRRAAGVTIEEARFEPYRVLASGGGSAQALADRTSVERLSLHDHFRSQREIISISDALCGYDLRVLTPPRSWRDRCPVLDRPTRWLEVLGQQQRARGSWRNDQELSAVLNLLETLSRCRVPWGDVAVITPYVGQLEALRAALKRLRVPLDEDQARAAWGEEGLALGTVHRFQGGERAIVIFSAVVTQDRSLTFLNERVNLVNVAVSRARDHLIVVGHPDVLRRGRYTRMLVERVS